MENGTLESALKAELARLDKRKEHILALLGAEEAISCTTVDEAAMLPASFVAEVRSDGTVKPPRLFKTNSMGRMVKIQRDINAVRNARILKWRKKGWTTGKLSKKFGLSGTMIRKILHSVKA